MNCWMLRTAEAGQAASKVAVIPEVRAALSNGGAVIVQPKFSATKFWDEAVRHGATMFTYVGELCRFLLSTPPHELERAHKISGKRMNPAGVMGDMEAIKANGERLAGFLGGEC